MVRAITSLVSFSLKICSENNKNILETFQLSKSGCRCFSVSTNNGMRFVQFQSKNGGPQHLGAQISQDGDVFDISAVDSSIPNSLVKFLATGNGVVEKAKRSVTFCHKQYANVEKGQKNNNCNVKILVSGGLSLTLVGILEI